MIAFHITTNVKQYRQKLVQAVQSELRLKEKEKQPTYAQHTHLISQYKQAMKLAPSSGQVRYVKRHIDKLRSDFVTAC
ncbi:MAG: hypothetical protein E3J72_05775 [Planctomycetota bacterium]|nr:MAG: hypothetical protein E3J72_05775 [Planctomycetota bacterium]